MIQKLEQIEQKYEIILKELENPEIISNQEEYRKLMREHKTLAPIVEKFREYKKAESAVRESEEMMKEQLDADFKAMCEAEYKQGKTDMQRCTEELKILLLPRDPDDDKNVIVEIRAGAGGEEAALFAGVLYRMYSMYAESEKFKTEVISANETGLGGFKEITFMVEGEGAFSKLKFESGVHRVQRVPETETSGRIHTSTVTVAVLPEAEDVEIEINPSDIKIESCKSSGAGGQHINKTDSAIRITHFPTGIVVSCQNERSQHKNKDMAMKMLKSKLVELKEQEQQQKIEGIKGEQKDIAWGSQIRSYVFHPYNLVKDHRTGYEMGNIGAVMDGELDGFINAYLKMMAQKN